MEEVRSWRATIVFNIKIVKQLLCFLCLIVTIIDSLMIST
jgi:hypothetical protein